MRTFESAKSAVESTTEREFCTFVHPCRKVQILYGTQTVDLQT